MRKSEEMLLLLNGMLRIRKELSGELGVLMTLDSHWFTRLSDCPSTQQTGLGVCSQPCAHTFQSVGQADSKHTVSAQSFVPRREGGSRCAGPVCVCVGGMVGISPLLLGLSVTCKLGRVDCWG